MDDHEKTLKSILRKSPQAFKEWVVTLSDEELTYIEWLLGKAEFTIDEILLSQSELGEAKELIEKIMKL